LQNIFIANHLTILIIKSPIHEAAIESCYKDTIIIRYL